MTKYTLKWNLSIFILSLLTQSTLAQPLLNKFKEIDIKNISGETLNLTTLALRNHDSVQYTRLIESNQQRFYSEHNLLDSAKRKLFMQDFTKSLDETRTKYIQNEILFMVDPQLLDTLSIEPLRRKGTLSSSKYIDNLIVPALRAGFTEYSLDKAKSQALSLLQNSNRLDSLLNYSIAYLESTGITVNEQTSETQIRSNLERLYFLPRGVAKEMADVVFTQVTEKVVRRIKSGAALHVENLNPQQIKQRLDAGFVQLLDDVRSGTEAAISELGNYLNELASNEVKVQTSIDNLYLDWKDVDSKINKLESDLRSTTLHAEDKLTAQAEHARLVAQNFLRLEVISKYLNYGSKALDVINRFQNGTYDKIFSADERRKFLEKVTSFDLPTITETIQGAAQAADFLSRQFPNSRAVKEVSKFINYAVAAISIGKGVAEIFSGNPMGVLSIIGGLKSLFGGAPQESPEMQMMKHMMDYMQKSFNAVFEHLEFIEKQLENLTILVQEMYRDMIKSFQVISDKLDRIEAREKVLDKRSIQILYRQFRNCDQLERNRNQALLSDSTFLKKFEDFQILYSSPSCKPCLTDLFTSAIRENLRDFASTSSTTAWDLSTIEIDTIYTPTKTLFKGLYQNNVNTAIMALAVPIKPINETNAIYSELVMKHSKLNADLEASLSIYYDYNMLAKLAHLLITYSVFVEIGDHNFKPKSVLRYLATPPAELNIKKTDLVDRLTAVLELINYSIAQQSLMAGNLMIEGTYQTLLGVNPKGENIELALQVLRSNRLFGKNFASRLILSSINSRQVSDPRRYKLFTNLYYEAKADSVKRQQLNDEFGTSFMKFVLNKEFNNIFLELRVRGHQVSIPVAEPSFILSNEMIQSDALIGLLNAKEQIINKLIDLTFFSRFHSQNETTLSDLKYLYEPF